MCKYCLRGMICNGQLNKNYGINSYFRLRPTSEGDQPVLYPYHMSDVLLMTEHMDGCKYVFDIQQLWSYVSTNGLFS